MSPFSTYNSDQSNSVPRNTPALSDVESSTGQNTRQHGNGFFKRSATTSPTPESTISRMSSFKLVRSRGEPFPKFSEFERDIDLLAIAQTSVQDGQDAAFELLLTIPAGANGTTHPLFQLPASIRRRIYGFCFPYEPRKVTLSPPFATKAVFPVEYFASPWDILDSTAGGLQSFSRLRNDLMAYFWSEYHFYVTVTEFSGPKFSPLSHVWLLRYLGTVQRITIEVDFTKFGCSQMKDAKKFGYDMSKTRQLLNAIVCGLGQRPASATVAELHLMCRRYAGFRPLDDTWVESSKGESARSR